MAIRTHTLAEELQPGQTLGRRSKRCEEADGHLVNVKER